MMVVVIVIVVLNNVKKSIWDISLIIGGEGERKESCRGFAASEPEGGRQGWGRGEICEGFFSVWTNGFYELLCPL